MPPDTKYDGPEFPVTLKGEDVMFYGDLATENLALEFCGYPADIINEDNFIYLFRDEKHASDFQKIFKGLITKKK
jgi:hypothetical protein